MKILLIGSDENVFDSLSPVRHRLEKYASQVEHITSMIASKKPREEVVEEKYNIVPVYGKNRVITFFRMLSRAKKIKDIDMVSGRDTGFLGLIGYFVAKHLGAKFHLQIHTEVSNKAYTKGLRGFVQWQIAKFLIPRADGIRTVSRKIITDLEKKGVKIKAKVNVLPIYVRPTDDEGERIEDPVGFYEFRKRHDVNMLIMSRLEVEKGVMEGLEIFADVLTKKTNLGIVVVGSGTEKNKLEKFVKEKNMSDHVMFYDWTTTPSYFYRKSDILWLNSAFEGYGMTIIEAGLFGCPVLSTKVGVATEVIKDGENGYLYDVGDTKKVKEILMNIADNPETVKLMKGKVISNTNVINYADENDYVSKIAEDWKTLV
ncbi:MAG: glycosyltransferase [Candidatus Pacebacteria bacterium]|nr:glycosyltransferase [Candidatus Paceibacterota bacterium]MBP9772366.1 glycosyltransferase [Candidatus Paceibacterota bacterium]